MTDSGPSREANRISERLIGVIYTMHESAPPRGRSQIFMANFGSGIIGE